MWQYGSIVCTKRLWMCRRLSSTLAEMYTPTSGRSWSVVEDGDFNVETDNDAREILESESVSSDTMEEQTLEAISSVLKVPKNFPVA